MSLIDSKNDKASRVDALLDALKSRFSYLPEIIDFKGVAAILNVAPNTIPNWESRGKFRGGDGQPCLESFKIGRCRRWHKSDVINFVLACTSGGAHASPTAPASKPTTPWHAK